MGSDTKTRAHQQKIRLWNQRSAPSTHRKETLWCTPHSLSLNGRKPFGTETQIKWPIVNATEKLPLYFLKLHTHTRAPLLLSFTAKKVSLPKQRFKTVLNVQNIPTQHAHVVYARSNNKQNLHSRELCCYACRTCWNDRAKTNQTKRLFYFHLSRPNQDKWGKNQPIFGQTQTARTCLGVFCFLLVCMFLLPPKRDLRPRAVHTLRRS